MIREMAFGGGRALQGRFGGGARFSVLRSVGAVLPGLLLAAAAACDADRDAPNASPVPAPVPSRLESLRPDGDYVIVGVNQGDVQKYGRVEASGRVELAVHTWWEMEDFFRGQISVEQVSDIFRRVRDSGVLEMDEEISANPASPHPTYGQIEVRLDGRSRSLRYSLRDAPPKLQDLHQFLTNPFTCSWPRNPEEGDYVRSYAIDRSREVVNPALPHLSMTAGELAQHPELEACLRQTSRLVRAGAPGASWERGRGAGSPPEFFLTFEETIYHVLVLEYHLANGGEHE